jgi:TM2 domain-containing membrane protein YozV
MSRYYMADGMVQRGPYELSDLPGQGLRADTLVWKEGMEQWRRADEVEEVIFAGVLNPAPPGIAPPAFPPPPQPAGLPYHNPYQPSAPPYNPAGSNRVLAGVLGIVLGSLGIHKFVLGMPGAGIIMLLVTVLTCGWGGIIMNVIGIIEGIIYLTRTDEQFYYEYVVQKKQWF